MNGTSRVITNRVKTLFEEGKPTLGTWLSLPACASAEAMSYIGWDWLVVDTEHAAHNIETVENLIRTIERTDAVPMVRVGWNDHTLLKWALDRGAMGVVIPWVNSREEAERAVESCMFPPKGIRGIGGGRTTMYDMDEEAYMEAANDNIAVIVQIETAAAVENADEILSVEGVAGTFIGPADLSASMGIYGKLDDPRFEDAIQTVLKACKKYGVAAGMHVGTPEAAAKRIEQGFQFIALADDIEFSIRGAKQAFGRVSTLTNGAVGLNRRK